MAVIICPECGGKVSDKIERCIHCGFILKEEQNKKKKESKKTNPLSVIFVLLLFFGGYYVYYAYKETNPRALRMKCNEAAKEKAVEYRDYLIQDLQEKEELSDSEAVILNKYLEYQEEGEFNDLDYEKLYKDCLRAGGLD